MILERLHTSCSRGSGLYAQSYMMKGSSLAYRLGEIMSMRYDIQDEVNHYGEDTQTCIHELCSMLQTMIEWCDEVTQFFGVNPPFLPIGMRTIISILAPPGPTTSGQHSGSTFDH